MDNCNYCGSIEINEFISVFDRFSNERFQYVKCSNCGLIFLENIPLESELLRYYPQAYEAYNTQGGHRILEKKIKLIRSYSGNISSILDIGCSDGKFLTVAKEKGINHVFGVEINPHISKIASENGIMILGKTIDDAYQSGMRFDVITLWDVFEHLPDPTNALCKIFTMLNHNGFLFMSIPNLDCFDRFVFGSNWIGWDAPRHFYLYNQELLKRLLLQTGFEFKKIQCFTGAKGAFDLSLDKKFSKPISHSKLYPFLSLLLWPYRQLGYGLNRCPVITVVARKKF